MTLLDTYSYQNDTIDRLVRILDDLGHLYYERIVLTEEEQKSLHDASRTIRRVKMALERREGETYTKLNELVKVEE